MKDKIEAMHRDRTDAEHRKRLTEAFLDWGAIDPSALPSHPLADPSRPPLPKLTDVEAWDWAHYAWWLRDEAWNTRRGKDPKKDKAPPPFTLDDTTEGLVLAPDYWQRRLREEKAVKDIQEMAKRPLPEVRIVAGLPPGWLKKEPLKSDVVMVPEEDTVLSVPEEIHRILTGRITDEKEFSAVVLYLQEVVARYRVRIAEMKNLALGVAYHRGREDAQPHVPTKSGPRDDTQLERALHQHAMVRYLVQRYPRAKMTRGCMNWALLAVADATARTSESVVAACKRAHDHCKELFPAEP